MPIADLPGLKLHYEVAGSGHPIIFLHGGCLDGRMWGEQVAALSKVYTAVTLDLRGHGCSEAPATGYAPRDYMQDVRALIQSLGITKPTLAGHSLGGSVALEYALAYPNEVAALALVSAGLEGREVSHLQTEQRARRRELVRRKGVQDGLVRALLGAGHFDGLRGDPAKRDLVYQMLSAWSGANWLDRTPRPPHIPHAQRLKEIKAPALVLVGEDEGERYHQAAQRLTEGIAVSRKAVVPGAGHLAPMENPDAVNDLLLDFLGGAVGKSL